MDENVILQPGSPTEADLAQDPKLDIEQETLKDDVDRVFDISDDLNILPVKEGPDNGEGKIPSIPIQFVTPKPVTPPPKVTSPAAPTNPITTQVAAVPVPATPITQIPPVQTTPFVPVPPTPVAPIKEVPLEKGPVIINTSGDSVVPEPKILYPNEPHDPNLKPLRTYENDVAEAMARGQASMSSMVLAEQKKKAAQKVIPGARPPRAPGHAAKQLFFILLIIIFLGAGVIGSYYLYSKSPIAPSVPVPIAAKAAVSLIPSDSFIALATDNMNTSVLKTRLEREIAKEQPAGTIREIIPTKLTDGQKMRISGPEMIGLLNIPTPSILLRSLDKPAMIGVYSNQTGEKSVFAVVTTTLFQNTFTGMLQWENVMADDLKYYLAPSDIKGVANVKDTGNNTVTSTSTKKSTTTPAVQPFLTIRGHFVDRIIKNNDVRAFQTTDNKILFLYSFVDNNKKLVITNKEGTLAEIITRLEKSASIR